MNLVDNAVDALSIQMSNSLHTTGSELFLQLLLHFCQFNSLSWLCWFSAASSFFALEFLSAGTRMENYSLF
jgi:hypothetical protein